MTTLTVETTVEKVRVENSTNGKLLQNDPMPWQPTPQVITLPQEMLSRYVSVALQSAAPHQTETGKWYCALDTFPGVWADGDSLKENLDSLEEVLRDWLLVKIVNRDTDIPVIDEIDLSAVSRRF
jgi:predicted RNase H-like HicB family nuclease